MTHPATKTEIVSSEEELLILVDGDDREVGFLEKSACHDGAGVLHRAFSLFVLNSAGEVLIQKRASGKRLWPDYWSNSCCSHPRRGEAMHEAAHRRLHQELGMTAPLEFLYKFEYQADYRGLGAEHELCSVYVGHSDATPVINTTEIGDWRWIARGDLKRELDTRPEEFTPWFLMEWERILRDHPGALRA